MSEDNEAVVETEEEGHTVDFPVKLLGFGGGIVSVSFDVGGEEASGSLLESSIHNWDEAWTTGDNVTLQVDNAAVTAMQMATSAWQKQHAEALANQE